MNRLVRSDVNIWTFVSYLTSWNDPRRFKLLYWLRGKVREKCIDAESYSSSVGVFLSQTNCQIILFVVLKRRQIKIRVYLRASHIPLSFAVEQSWLPIFEIVFVHMFEPRCSSTLQVSAIRTHLFQRASKTTTTTLQKFGKVPKIGDKMFNRSHTWKPAHITRATSAMENSSTGDLGVQWWT